MTGLRVWVCPKAAVFRFSEQGPVETALPSRLAPYGTILTQLNPLSFGFWKWDTQRDADLWIVHARRLIDSVWAAALRQQSQWEQRGIWQAATKETEKPNCFARDTGSGHSGPVPQRGEWCLTELRLQFGHFWLMDTDFFSSPLYFPT